MIKNVLVIFSLLMTNYHLIAQNQDVTLIGKVVELQSNESLIGATAYLLGTKYIANTDGFGLLNIKTVKGTYRLIVSYVGYVADTTEIKLTKDTSLLIFLKPKNLSEIVIKGNNFRTQDRIGTMSIPMTQLKSIPAILGEIDVLRALTMLPGVSNGTEGSVGLNVRGGSPEQNLILLDGASVYNSSHLFGFLSAFNADAIKRVELIKGGFPAKYGGRLSSVINVAFKDGNKEKRNTEIGLGILASKIFTEGYFTKKRSSYIFSARSSYLDIINYGAKNKFYNGGSQTFRDYKFYDINGKVDFLIGKSSSLSAGYFHSNDFFITAKKRQNSSIAENVTKWSNSISNIKYVQSINKSLIFNSQIILNLYKYNFDVKNTLTDSVNKTDDNNFKISNQSTIYDISHKNNFNWSINNKWNITFGTELFKQYFKPNVTQYTLEGIDINQGENKNSNFRTSFSVAFFADVYTKWTDNINSNIGVRIVNYIADRKAFPNIEPRLSLDYEINKQNSLKASFSVMNQPLHILSNATVGFTNDAWVPATKLTPPESAKQYALGYIKTFPKYNFYFSIETYFKTMNNLIDYTEGGNPVFNNSIKGYESVVQKAGKGRAWGIELLIHKEIGKWNGIIEYTLSRTERQFKNINFGEWYPSRFDRTHDLAITLNHELSGKWSISSSFLYSTGTPISGPTYLYALPQELSPNLLSFDIYYRGKNNTRLPDYHRLDLSVNYKPKKYYDQLWSFGAYNTYNKSNTISKEYNFGQIQSDGISNNNVQYIYGYYSNSTLFPFIPYISYNIKFKKND